MDHARQPELPIDLSREVAQAQEDGSPIVALESTVLAHGLPWPRNLETGLAMEDQVRRAGATPATIAILDGRIKIGLSKVEIERVARGPVPKASRRDLGSLLASGASGALTVAGTLVAMQAAGLQVLATGGIGGVHRGAEQSFDVSADLGELARCCAVVVCSGVKAILDLPRSLELLESLGVPVVGFQTDTVAGFYAASSGLPVPARADSAEQVGHIARTHWALPGGAGLLLAVPVPTEAAIPEQELFGAIERAVGRARVEQVRGGALTPFLLNAVAEATAGRSIEANVALLRNNASVAAQVATALNNLANMSP